MLLFCLKCTACLVLFWLFYKGVLEQHKMHVFNRIFLLASIVASITIPLITFTSTVVQQADTQPFLITVVETDTIEQNVNWWPIILWSVYGIGLLIFAIKFCANLLSIYNRIKRNPHFTKGRYKHVLLQFTHTPHTFFTTIFFPKEAYLQEQIPKEVFWHEETHAQQRHSIDILLIELLHIFFWFNPIIYFYKKSIQLNHEFLADQGVLKKGVYSSTYQNILLDYATSAHHRERYQLAMTNPINYSSIKKRFKIMKKTTSKTSVILRSSLAIPLTLVLLYGLSNKEVKTIEAPEVLTQQTPEILEVIQEKATKEQISEYNTLAKKYNKMLKKEHFTIKKSEMERVTYLYSLLSKEQKEKAAPFPNFPPPPPVISEEKEIPEIIEVVEEIETPKVIEVVEEKEYPVIVKTFNTAVPSEEEKEIEIAPNVIVEKEEVIAVVETTISPKTYLFEYAKELAKKKAAFYYNDQPISSEKGLRIIKEKKGVVTITHPKTNATPEVKIYSKEKAAALGGITPPAPPAPPKSPEKHLKEMAEKGAVFYHKNQEISLKEALEVVKDTKKLDVVTTKNEGVTKVTITTD